MNKKEYLRALIPTLNLAIDNEIPVLVMVLDEMNGQPGVHVASSISEEGYFVWVTPVLSFAKSIIEQKNLGSVFEREYTLDDLMAEVEGVLRENDDKDISA